MFAVMSSVTKDVRLATIQLLLDSGAATSINAKSAVASPAF
jgi:hypothetical protein